MLKTTIYIFSLFALLGSCKQQNKQAATNDKNQTNFEEITHSELFTIQYHPTYKEITILNPWIEGETYAKYILVPKRGIVPESLPKKSIVIRTPIEKIVTLSTTHIGLYNKLKSLDKIVGVATEQYIYNEKIKEQTKQGKIKEVGADKNLNIELLIDINPDIVTTSGFQTISRPLEVATQAGIRVVYTLGWMEKSPLARAEWIKFIAAFIDENNEAKAIFDKIVYEYTSVKKRAENASSKPKVLVGKKWKGMWNTSGGASYFAHFLRDSGADYYWSKDTNSGSLELSFEEVIDKQLNTDIWINPGNSLSIKDLLASDNRYGLFKPVNQGQVYGYFNKLNSDGANAYWEKGPIEPHIILSDLIKIFHPGLLPDYQLCFYKKLE